MMIASQVGLLLLSCTFIILYGFADHAQHGIRQELLEVNVQTALGRTTMETLTRGIDLTIARGRCDHAMIVSATLALMSGLVALLLPALRDLFLHHLLAALCTPA